LSQKLSLNGCSNIISQIKMICNRAGVAPIVEKMVETLLRWFGRVKRVNQIEMSQITRGKDLEKL